MAKNITALLQKGNLTPKERFLLIVANEVSEERDGKSILTEADKHALSEGWTPKDNNEVREYNRYHEGWRLAGFAELDAQTIFLSIKAEYFRQSIIKSHLIFHPIYKNTRNLIERLEKIKVVDIKEAIEITEKQRAVKLKDGFDFDYAVFNLAMELLGDKDRAKLEEARDEDIIIDETTITDETKIADLLAGKTELTKEAKEKLAELVGKHSTNNYTKESQLYYDYAGIPLYEVAERFLKDKGVKFSDSKDKVIGRAGRVAMEMTGRDTLDKAEKLKDILEDYARDNKTTIEAILKGACLKWLDEDLLKQHPPLVLSHKELFNKWLKTKAEAKETLEKLIAKGELKIQGETRQDRTITGESLYNLKSDYEFVKDFKKQVDEYEANAGRVYADNDPEQKGDNLDVELLITNKGETGELDITSMFGLTIKQLKNKFETTQFIRETEKDGEIILDIDEDYKKVFKETRESIINGYARLLAFEEIFKKLSKIYEADLTFKINGWLKEVSYFIDRHNEALSYATGQKLHGGDDSEGSKEAQSWLIKHRGVSKTKDDLFIDKEKIKPNKDDERYGVRMSGIERYYKELAKIFDKEF